MKKITLYTAAALSGYGASALLNTIPAYNNLINTSASFIIANSSMVLATSGIYLASIGISYAINNIRNTEVYNPEIHNKKHKKENDLKVLFKLSGLGLKALFNLTNNIAAKLFNTAKNTIKTKPEIKESIEEIKPVKPVKKVNKTKKVNKVNKNTKVKYQPLSASEIHNFKMRLNKIESAPLGKLTGKEKEHILKFQKNIRQVNRVLNTDELFNLHNKNGIIRVVRMTNKLINTKDVVNFSMNKNKLTELYKLTEAVFNRQKRKNDLINLADSIYTINNKFKESQETGLEYLDIKNQIKQEIENSIKEVNKTTKKIESKSKSTIKPKLIKR